MAQIVINALSLRPGGGLQVLVALTTGLSKLRGNDHFTILYSDQQTKQRLQLEFSNSTNITFKNPINRSGAINLYKWQMLKLASFLSKSNARLIIGLNHHFPSGDTPQIIYSVNTLRFKRSKKLFFAKGEIANRLRDARSLTALRQADTNVFESKYLLDLARLKNPQLRNPKIIYIGRDNKTKPLPSLYSPLDPAVVMVMTSPQPHKDNPTLIQTLERLCKLQPNIDWRMKIAGGTTKDSFARLKTLARKLNVDDRIEWLGFQPHDVLQKHARRAVCLLSTSLTESFSMVALESMSWSCPVVLTNAASMPESIQGAGLLATAKDPNDFAHKIIQYRLDDKLRSKVIELGHARIKNLTWMNAAKEFDGIIQPLLQKVS